MQLIVLIFVPLSMAKAEKEQTKKEKIVPSDKNEGEWPRPNNKISFDW